MTLSKRVLTGLAATATTGALVLGTPGMAQAATYDRGNSDRERVSRDADGDAESRAKATDRGRLSVRGEARGGASGVPLGGDPETIARATASVNKSIPVADGTYRVTVRYSGAQGNDSDRQGGDARADLLSTVRFDGRTLRNTRELDSDPSRVVSRFVIDIPEGSSGRLNVNAALRGAATAPTEGDYGRFNGSVRDVQFSVNRLRD